MSDAIIMGTKASKTPAVAYSYQSQVVDGLIKPFGKDKAEVASGHPGLMHTESETLNRMIREYLSLKFTAIDPAATTKIDVRVSDFWIEQYSPDSGGKQFMAVMFGGETNTILTAYVDLVVDVTAPDGTVTSKAIRASGDNTHVSGYGTGTETSKLYRGTNSYEFAVANAINAANNRAIAMLNQLLEANSI